MQPPPAAEVITAYRSGVDAIARVTSSFDDRDWSRPACGAWDATDTTRHLVGVIRWYHQWLDRAEKGIAEPPFDPSEFPERNAAGIDALASLGGPEAASTFVAEATAYLDRVVSCWDLPFGYPPGVVTAGLHVGVAATEWHLHCWDLTNGTHEPDQARTLFLAAGAAIAAPRAPLVRRALGVVLPLASRRSPWKAMLRRSGRT